MHSVTLLLPITVTSRFRRWSRLPHYVHVVICYHRSLTSSSVARVCQLQVRLTDHINQTALVSFAYVQPSPSAPKPVIPTVQLL